MATIEMRVAKDGSKSYRAKVRKRGQEPRTRTFDTKAAAEAWAKGVETDLARGVHVPNSAERRRTLADLIDAYLRDYLPVRGMRDESGHRALLEWWRKEYGYATLERLKPELIAKARGELLKRKTRDGSPVSGATVNRYITALSAACKWAWKEMQWLPANPVLAVTKVRESTGIVRYLNDEERAAVLDACRASDDPNIYCAVMLALATGARYSNIRELKWADVDLTRWRLRFVTVKNGQPRFVPVVGAAKAALQAQFERDPTKEGWVFKGRSDHAPAAIEKHWRKVRSAAGVEDVRFHDLRHTAASYLTMNGATLAEVAEVLGHRTLVMAKRYSHQSGEHVRSTLEKMAERFL